MSPVTGGAADHLATATLTIETTGSGFTDITAEVRRFVQAAAACDGFVLMFARHTSASLTIQENADPAVLTDLAAALDRLAPRGGWSHDTEGPDDMPGHVKTMLTSVCLHVPVARGALALGAWQSIYLIEHRAQPHRREVVMQFVGSRI